MGLDDKASNKTEEATGSVKEGFGKLTGDRETEAEGKGQKNAMRKGHSRTIILDQGGCMELHAAIITRLPDIGMLSMACRDAGGDPYGL